MRRLISRAVSLRATLILFRSILQPVLHAFCSDDELYDPPRFVQHEMLAVVPLFLILILISTLN